MKLRKLLDLLPSGTLIDVFYDSGDFLFRKCIIFPEEILSLLNKKVIHISPFSTSNGPGIFIMV